MGNLDKLKVLNVANTSDHIVSASVEAIAAVASLLVAILDGDTIKNPPEYNDVYGCIPSRLQGQLDTEQSNLGGRAFCDGSNEAESTNARALEYAVVRGDTTAAQTSPTRRS